LIEALKLYIYSREVFAKQRITHDEKYNFAIMSIISRHGDESIFQVIVPLLFAKYFRGRRRAGVQFFSLMTFSADLKITNLGIETKTFLLMTHTNKLFNN
jgi:hypothetical protein